ncbi:hypothetical protein DFH09DRAFT_1339517 [Mycena vulgaris]|nr:hypothetical protein DFH09DRAFT_1339517 [Mycena vulgaris]
MSGQLRPRHFPRPFRPAQSSPAGEHSTHGTVRAPSSTSPAPRTPFLLSHTPQSIAPAVFNDHPRRAILTPKPRPASPPSRPTSTTSSNAPSTAPSVPPAAIHPTPVRPHAPHFPSPRESTRFAN